MTRLTYLLSLNQRLPLVPFYVTLDCGPGSDR